MSMKNCNHKLACDLQNYSMIGITPVELKDCLKQRLCLVCSEVFGSVSGLALGPFQLQGGMHLFGLVYEDLITG